MLQERAIGRRFALEDVQSGPGDLPRAQRVQERGLVHERSPGDVDEVDPGLHGRERLGVQKVVVLPRLGGVQADHVRVLEERAKIDHRGRVAARRDERVIGHQMDLERCQPAGDLARDAPVAHQTHIATRELASMGSPLPPPRLRRRGRWEEVSHEEEREGDREFRHAGRGGARSIDDADVACARGGHIDVIDPDPGPRDELELGSPAEQARVDLGTAAHDERPRVGEGRLEGGGARARVHDAARSARAETLHRGSIDRVRDDHGGRAVRHDRWDRHGAISPCCRPSQRNLGTAV